MLPSLSQEFEAKAAPPEMLGVQAYARLLEKLVREGRGYGKTKPVAAYRLLDMVLATEQGKEKVARQNINFPDLYIVMDPAVWRNGYIRALGVEDIAEQWAKRIVEEKDVNVPDFMGPGVWTAKGKTFEEDYVRRSGVDENGKPLTIHDPNPAAHRVCLDITEPVSVPMLWGAPYVIGAGGTLAVREKDMPALIDALDSIHTGKLSAFEALFEKKDGRICTRFDVYGMEPGFCRDNYDPVPLEAKTVAAVEAFAALPEMPLSSSLPLPVEAILAETKFESLKKDGAVFWSGGGLIINGEDRTIVSVNEDLAQGFIRVQNCLRGEDDLTDMMGMVDPYGRGGPKSALLPRKAEELSSLEEREFWRRMSARFVKAACGTIHVAANRALANGHFRLFEYPAIMANDDISHVHVLTGETLTEGVVPYIDTLSNVFNRGAAYDQWVDCAGRDNIHLVSQDVIFDDNLKTLTKADWAAQQKQAWFEAARQKLVSHLEGTLLSEDARRYDSVFSERTRTDMVYAKAAFVGEVFFSLREVQRLEGLGCAGHDVAAGLAAERQRLAESADILRRYPEILDFDGKPTEAERARSRSLRSGAPRQRVMTQELGGMLLLLDDTLSLDQKIGKWGRYEGYDAGFFGNSHIDRKNLGQPREMETYVRARLEGLKGEINQVLSNRAAGPRKPMRKKPPMK